MSIKIDITKFPNWSSIFEEIEIKWQEKMAFIAPKPDGAAKSHEEERKPRSSTMIEGERKAFTAIDPQAVGIYKETRKPRSSTMLEPQPTGHYNPSRRASDPSGYALKITQPRVRHCSAPSCPDIDRAKILSDSRLTENAKQLSDQELALLYEDILRPLDFYAMLHEGRKKL